MPDLNSAGKMAIKSALGALTAVLIFSFVYELPISAMLAAAGLIPVGAFVVGCLLALSIQKEEDD